MTIKFFQCAIMFSVIAASGCASVEETRNRAPDKSGVFHGSFEQIAKCVANEADLIPGTFFGSKGIGVPTLRINDAEGSARLFHLIEPSKTPQYELSFRQQGLGSVLVEGRGMVTIYGRDFFLRDLWPLVEKCETKLRKASSAKRF